MASDTYRIGELLVEQGVMTSQQVVKVLEAQRRLHQPFGVIAESMFEVTLQSIEQAWTEQYVRRTGRLDLRDVRVEGIALNMVTRRQAWQFQMLPLHFDEEGDLLIAAGRSRLPRAVTFAAHRLPCTAYFRVASDRQMERFLQRYFPLAGLRIGPNRRSVGMYEAA